MHRGLQIHKITEKGKLSYDTNPFAKKKKRTRNPDTNNENIQPEYRNGIRHWKCAMLTMKSGKRETTEQPKHKND